MLICRCRADASRWTTARRSALFCNVPLEAVIEEKDKDFSIYEVPLSLVDHGLDELIVEQAAPARGHAGPGRLAAPAAPHPQSEARDRASRWWASTPSTSTPTSRSTNRWTTPESATTARCGSARIRSEDIEREGPERLLSGYDGILVPGGFGERGIEGKIDAIRYAREREIPFFGICLGMQCAVIEFARHVAGLDGAHSTEFDKNTPHPVICLLDEQRNVTTRAARCGWGPSRPNWTRASRSAACYGRAEDFRAAPAPVRIQQPRTASSWSPGACWWRGPATTASWWR